MHYKYKTQKQHPIKSSLMKFQNDEVTLPFLGVGFMIGMVGDPDRF